MVFLKKRKLREEVFVLQAVSPSTADMKTGKDIPVRARVGPDQETVYSLQDAGAATVDAKTGKEISSKVGHYCRKILMR